MVASGSMPDRGTDALTNSDDGVGVFVPGL